LYGAYKGQLDAGYEGARGLRTRNHQIALIFQRLCDVCLSPNEVSYEAWEAMANA